MTSITSDFLKHKAREISYALNRVSFYIKRDDLRSRIERLSFEFLENVAVAAEDTSDKQSLIRVFKNTSALDVLVRIGHSLYEIETINSNILVRELDTFNSAIRKLAEESSAMGNSSEFGKTSSANPFAKQELNLESIFSMPPSVIIEPTKNTVENLSVEEKKEITKEKSNNLSVDSGKKDNQPIQLGSVIHQPVRSTVQSVFDPEGKKNSELSSKEIVAPTGKDFANIDNEKEIVERAYSSISEKVASPMTGATESEPRSEIYERENSIINEAMRDKFSAKGVPASGWKNEVASPVSTGQAIIRKFQNGITQQVRDESGNRTIRQNLISEKIRQSGKVNVKELLSKFPGVSERTIRYDLQSLCDRGVVEKIGSSGPGTSYSSKLPNP